MSFKTLLCCQLLVLLLGSTRSDSDIAITDVGNAISYIDAIAYCLGGGQRLCSSSDICPNGEGREPVGGTKTGQHKWVPVADIYNEWIQIGNSGQTVCALHSNLGATPPWGVGNEAYGFKQFVFCCPGDGNLATLEDVQINTDSIKAFNGRISELEAERDYYENKFEEIVAALNSIGLMIPLPEVSPDTLCGSHEECGDDKYCGLEGECASCESCWYWADPFNGVCPCGPGCAKHADCPSEEYCRIPGACASCTDCEVERSMDSDCSRCPEEVTERPQARPDCPEVCNEEGKIAICFPDQDDHLILICVSGEDKHLYFSDGGFDPADLDEYDCECNPVAPTAVPTTNPTAEPTSHPSPPPPTDRDCVACAGSGLIHVVPDGCMHDSGINGGGDSLEVYCIGGIARYCLSEEQCIWRNAASSQTCDRSGLSSVSMADVWCEGYLNVVGGLDCSTEGVASWEECDIAGGCDTCTGSGLIHVVPNSCMNDSGNNGGGDSLEVYCVDGIGRYCLSKEQCIWRNPDLTQQTCDRSGLNYEDLASVSCEGYLGVVGDLGCSYDGVASWEEC